MPALAPKPFKDGEKLVAIADIPDWAQPAFAGMTTLNRIQSRVRTPPLNATPLTGLLAFFSFPALSALNYGLLHVFVDICQSGPEFSWAFVRCLEILGVMCVVL